MMRGITLIEMVIGLGISALVGGLLVVIILNSTGLFYNQSSKLQTGVNINDVLSKVRSAIKEANSVDSTSSSIKLVLKVPSKDASGNIIPNTFDKFTFLRDGTILSFQVVPDQASTRAASDQILANLVESLTFKYFCLKFGGKI